MCNTCREHRAQQVWDDDDGPGRVAREQQAEEELVRTVTDRVDLAWWDAEMDDHLDSAADADGDGDGDGA